MIDCCLKNLFIGLLGVEGAIKNIQAAPPVLNDVMCFQCYELLVQDLFI